MARYFIYKLSPSGSGNLTRLYDEVTASSPKQAVKKFAQGSRFFRKQDYFLALPSDIRYKNLIKGSDAIK
jgi:hypothetical protein